MRVECAKNVEREKNECRSLLATRMTEAFERAAKYSTTPTFRFDCACATTEELATLRKVAVEMGFTMRPRDGDCIFKVADAEQ